MAKGNWPIGYVEGNAIAIISLQSRIHVDAFLLIMRSYSTPFPRTHFIESFCICGGSVLTNLANSIWRPPFIRDLPRRLFRPFKQGLKINFIPIRWDSPVAEGRFAFILSAPLNCGGFLQAESSARLLFCFFLYTYIITDPTSNSN